MPEGVAEFLRGAVRCVRVPIVNVQVPVVFPGVSIDPLKHRRGNLLGGFHPAHPGVVDLTEARIEAPGRMSLAKPPDEGGVKPLFFKESREAGAGEPVPKASVRPVSARIGANASMIDHPGVKPKPARHQRSTGGQARRIGTVVLVKSHSLGSDAIDVGRLENFSTVTTEIPAPHIVGKDDNDVRTLIRRGQG